MKEHENIKHKKEMMALIIRVANQPTFLGKLQN